MISLGIAANMNFEQQLEQFGDVLNMQVWNDTWGNNVPAVVLNDAMIEYINSWDGVEVATARLNDWIDAAQIGRRTSQGFQIIGISPEAMPFLPEFRDIAEGQLLQPGGDPFQAVFGSEIPFGFMTQRERDQHFRDMWGGGGGGWSMVRPMGMRVSPGRPGMPDDTQPPARVPLVDIFEEKVEISFIWGIFDPVPPASGEVDPNTPIIVVNRNIPIFELQPVGLMAGTQWESQHTVIMDIQTVKMLINARQEHQISEGSHWVTITDFDLVGYNNVVVRATDINVAGDVLERLEDMGFGGVWGPIGHINSLRETSESLQTMLTVIGAISLLVAFIGIANTMIMSIYERTKEIGVMKVIGAALSDIGKLFLVEAGMIGVFGGLAGLALSYGLSYWLNNLDEGIAFLDAFVPHGVEGYTSYIPLWLYGLAIGSSAVIGLIAGFLPAMRAMRISALTAIRAD